MVQSVLVTGGSGFIGSWCVVEAMKRGYAVRTTVRRADKEAGVRAMVAAAELDPAQVSFAHADLTSDEGWDAAVAGCDYVLHVASPLGGDASADRYAYVAPARDGTLRVLRAATKAGVKRVVVTSASAAARAPLKSGRIGDESVWSDPNDSQFDAYRVSKILAERAAWDFMREAGAERGLTTILPGAVFGPVLSKETIGSVAIIQGLLRGQPPGVPRIGFWVVDVRDLAALHVHAMTTPEAAGERFIAAADFMWMAEIAETLRTELGPRGAKAPKRRLPDFIVRAFALVTPNLRQVTPMLGVKFAQTSEKAHRLLGFSPRPATQTIVDCAESLLALATPSS